jgi:phosphoribosylformimino-5-aminoimidazole carboxamide ribotide isomerase
MFKIIPAIDIINSQAVRLTKGDYAQIKVYSDDPAKFAKKFEPFGFIHLVDLDGAKAGRPINLETLKKIRAAVDCKLEVGGGIRTKTDAKTVLNLGIDQIILGSIALKNKKLTEELVSAYGSKIVIGVDTKNGRVAAEGWLETSQTTGLALIKEMEKIGIKTVICTDIARDGTLTGPNIELYQELTEQTKINIVASGGIGNIDDVKALKKIKKLGGIVIGKAIYEERVSIEELLELA